MQRIVTDLLFLASFLTATGQWYTVNTGVTGPFEGINQDVDVYIYILKTEMAGGEVVFRKGNVKLLR